jgi:TPR repeat protein
MLPIDHRPPINTPPRPQPPQPPQLIKLHGVFSEVLLEDVVRMVRAPLMNQTLLEAAKNYEKNPVINFFSGSAILMGMEFFSGYAGKDRSLEALANTLSQQLCDGFFGEPIVFGTEEKGEEYSYRLSNGLKYGHAVLMIERWPSPNTTDMEPEISCLPNVDLHALKWSETIKKAHSVSAEAIEQLNMDAINGDAIAQYYLGLLYKEGMGLERNNNSAYQLFSAAAKQGHLEAEVQRGLMREWGIGCQQNLNKAVQYFESAAELGHPYAQFYLTTLSKGIERQPINSTHCRWKAPEGAWYWEDIGNAHVEGECVQEKFNAITNESDLKALADQGYAPAQFLLGMIMREKLSRARWDERGSDDFKAKEEALQYIKKAADQGYALAQLHYGEMTLDHDRVTAMNYLKAAADQSHPKAQFLYALRLDDRALALEYFKMSADQAHAGAQYKVGMERLNAGDTEAALHYLESAAHRGRNGLRGYPPAQFQLGLLALQRGDEEEGLNYIMRASFYYGDVAGDYVPAQYKLSSLLRDFKKNPQQFCPEGRIRLANVEQEYALHAQSRFESPSMKFQRGLIALSDKKIEVALQLFTEAGEQGHVPAQFLRCWMLARYTPEEVMGLEEVLLWMESSNISYGEAGQKYAPAQIEFRANAFAQFMEGNRTGTVLAYLPTELAKKVINYINYPSIERDFSALAWFEPDCWGEQYIYKNWTDNSPHAHRAERPLGWNHPVKWGENLSSSSFKQALMSWDNHGFKPDAQSRQPSAIFST